MFGMVTGLIASAGVNSVVNSVIKASVPATMGFVEKNLVGIGTIVIDLAITGAVFKNIDAGVKSFKQHVKDIKIRNEVQKRCKKL